MFQRKLKPIRTVPAFHPGFVSHSKGVEKTRIGQTVVRNSNYWLMACNRINEGDHFYAYCKLYSCRIIKDGAVVRNFVPCIRKSDGKVGLYDLVTDTFFVNQGTGEFIAGPTV